MRKILITNDDGIDAKGLERLAEAAKELVKSGSLPPRDSEARHPTVSL